MATSPNKVFSKLKTSLILGPIIVFLITLPTLLQLAKPGYFKMHDDMQAMRVFQMSKCFADFQIPCRWVPDMGYGYGYPQFEYYGPLPYYLMTFVSFFGVSYFDSVKIGFGLALLLGNMSIYFLGLTLWGNWGGLISALFYAYAPYRVSDVFSRGAMGESWGFVFIPLVFLFLTKIVQDPKHKNSIFFGLSLAGLISTHNISTLITSPFALVYLLFLLLKEKSNLAKKIKFVFLGGLWGLGFSSYFLFPLLFEKQYAHTESLIGGYFDYRAHFVTLYQLFISTFWGVGSSEIGPHDDLSFFVGILPLSFTVIALMIAFIKRKSLKFTQIATYFLFTIFFGIASFMTHEKSSLVWKLLPPLVYLQFPWRFLVLVNLFICISLGYLGVLITKSQRSLLGLIFFLLFVLNISFFKPDAWFNYSVADKFSGKSWDKQMTISIFDYLPTAAKFPPADSAPILPLIKSGNAGILNYLRTSNSFTFTTNSISGASIEIPTFCFPGWHLYLDHKPSKYSCNGDLGLINFSVPSGLHQVAIKLEDSIPRRVGDLATFFTLIALIVFAIKSNHAKK